MQYDSFTDKEIKILLALISVAKEQIATLSTSKKTVNKLENMERKMKSYLDPNLIPLPKYMKIRNQFPGCPRQ